MKENEIENWICLRPLIYRQLRVLIEISMILHPILQKKKKKHLSLKKLIIFVSYLHMCFSATCR